MHAGPSTLRRTATPRCVFGSSVDVGMAPPVGGSRSHRAAGAVHVDVAAPSVPHTRLDTSRRSACHRAPYRWRPGCSCPMITDTRSRNVTAAQARPPASSARGPPAATGVPPGGISYGSGRHRPLRPGQLRQRRALRVVRPAPRGGAGLLASGPGRLRRGVLGGHPVRRLRRRQPRLRALLVRPSDLPLPRHRRGAPRAAADDDGQHGPADAHPLPAAGQQGVHPPHDPRPRGQGRGIHRQRSSTPCASRGRPTSSSRSPPSCPSRSSPTSWACPRRTGTSSSTGRTAWSAPTTPSTR